MNMIDIISDKRYSRELSDEQIEFFINGVKDKSIPDYQISALLMAIVLNGMTPHEMTSLTMAMANSGKQNDLSYLDTIPVDKHSTGGVGDKCTPLILPLVASFGVKSVKLSGRGLGFTGGTVDKFESIEGFNCSIPVEDFPKLISKNGMVISGQTPELAPADKILYSLRDVTATIDSIPLIASSIMSKKIAGGAKAMVLDVTFGDGAFMKTIEDARKLANAMIDIGKLANRRVVCVLSSMAQPLGKNCGNVLEMQEVFEVLSGKASPDLLEVVSTISANMVMLSEKNGEFSYDELKEECKKRLLDGTALGFYDDLIIGQGGMIHSTGSPIYKDYPDEVMRISAVEAGYVTAVHADKIGRACVLLGAGRLVKSDEIDFGAGISLYKKIGDPVKRGETVAVLFKGRNSTIDDEKVNLATDLAFDAFSYSSTPPVLENVIADVCC